MALGTAAELDFMLKDSGVAVSYGSAPVQTTYGQFDRGEILVEGQNAPMQLLGRSQSLVIRDGTLTGLTADTPITIDGSAYTIVDVGVPDTEGWRRIQVLEGAQ
jgi:hypothetical protein